MPSFLVVDLDDNAYSRRFYLMNIVIASHSLIMARCFALSHLSGFFLYIRVCGMPGGGIFVVVGAYSSQLIKCIQINIKLMKRFLGSTITLSTVHLFLIKM